MEFIPAIPYTANVCRDKRFIANHGHRMCVNTIDFRLIDLDNFYPFLKRITNQGDLNGQCVCASIKSEIEPNLCKRKFSICEFPG